MTKAILTFAALVTLPVLGLAFAYLSERHEMESFCSAERLKGRPEQILDSARERGFQAQEHFDATSDVPDAQGGEYAFASPAYV
jgi:hypothetical protein